MAKDEVVKVIKIEAQGSETTVKQLRQEIASLRDALLNTEKGSDEYKKTVEQLTNTQNRLNEVMKAGKDVFVGSKQELKSLKQQLDKLQEGTTEYNAAFQRAADITHTLQERQELLKYSAADVGTQLQNVVSIGSSLAAGFNSINAVMALTGSKSEDLQKVMVKLQAGIALVQGLQGLEGMTKRMKGLVAGMTEMIFQTNATTTAVNTNTTAVAANATAQEANAAATTTATIATNAFGKALIATGIGAIIVLIGSLIAHWEDLKDMIGLSNEKLDAFNAIMDKIKVTIAGVSEVIYQYFIAGIKNTITAVSTLGKVLKDVFTFNFSQLEKDVKEGWQKIADQTKKGLDVVGNYREGAAKKQAKLDEKHRIDALKASAEELNEYIKDMEAKEGAEWKYTEAGKKAYDQYFEKKLATYKKDSKEYKELLRQKWSYDREYNANLNKASTAQSKQTKEEVDQRLKEAEAVAKRAQESIKEEEQKLKEKYEYEKALLEEKYKDAEDYYDAMLALAEEYNRNLQKIEEKKKAEQKRKDAEAAREKREKSQNAVSTTDRAVDAIENKYNAQQTKIELEYSLKEAAGTGKLSFADLIEETNKIYELNKQRLQEQADEYKALMENADADDEAKLTAKKEYEAKIEEIQNLETQNLIDNLDLQRAAVQEQIKMYSDLANAIGDIFGSIADILEDDIKAKVKNGEITQEEGEKQFKAVKAFQIAQATIQTISGAIAAFMSCQSLGWPWGTIIGAAQAAAVTAAGIAQIAKIKNTQLGGSSTVSSQMTAGAAQTQPEEYTPQYTANATGESEITKLADSIKSQRVYVVESDITEAQNRSKVRVTESTW